MKELKKLRQKIDKIDKKLLEILAQRFSLTKKVGKYKVESNLPIYDKKREGQILKKLNLEAKKLKLNRNLVKGVFKFILETTKKNHENFKN